MQLLYDGSRSPDFTVYAVPPHHIALSCILTISFCIVITTWLIESSLIILIIGHPILFIHQTCVQSPFVYLLSRLESTKVKVVFFQWVNELKLQRQICYEANEAYMSSAWELSKILGGGQAPYVTVHKVRSLVNFSKMKYFDCNWSRLGQDCCLFLL